MKKKFKWIYVAIFIMVATGALMIGITDYLSYKISGDEVEKTDFWANVLTTNLGVLCLILSILLFKIDNFISNNENYQKVSQGIYEHHEKKFLAPLWLRFSYEENKQRKIDAYKQKIGKKMEKLKPSATDLEIFFGTDKEAKSKNKYCQEYLKLEYKIGDDYINRNILHMRVDYDAISEGLVYSGAVENQKHLNYVTKYKWWRVVKDLFPKFLLSIAMTAITTALVIETKDGITMEMIFRTASKVFTIISQTYFAISFGNKYNEEVTMHDILFRQGITTAYDLWLSVQTDKTQKGVV